MVLALTVACGLAAVIWAYLVVAHGGYWLTTQRLPPAADDENKPVTWPDVVAVIPARDEAEMVPVALPTLLDQEYPGGFSVILVDDCSSDGTGEIAERLGRQYARAVTVIGGKPREEGWAGKVWAMSQGLAAASNDTEYILFTDADIAWEPGALRDLVKAAEAGHRDLVSQMALLRSVTSWERILVPAFVYFFAQLYPFRRVNRPAARTAAAAGGCMLVRRTALHESGGLAPIAGAQIDDVALGQMIKRQGGRTWLGLTTQVKSVRPYDKLASLWQMISRSAYTQLRYSPPLLLGTVIGLLLSYVVPPVGAIIGLAVGDVVTAGLGFAGWVLMSVTFLPMLRLYRLSPLRAPTLPLIALLYAAMTLDSARLYYAGRGGQWKGRTTGSSTGP